MQVHVVVSEGWHSDVVGVYATPELAAARIEDIADKAENVEKMAVVRLGGGAIRVQHPMAHEYSAYGIPWPPRTYRVKAFDVQS